MSGMVRMAVSIVGRNDAPLGAAVIHNLVPLEAQRSTHPPRWMTG